MGNEISVDDEGEVFEKGFKLDSPDADGAINYGTAAPRIQPRHTEDAIKREERKAPDPKASESALSVSRNIAEESEEAGQEVVMMHDPASNSPESMQDEDGSSRPISPKHRRNFNAEEERRKRQHLSDSQTSNHGDEHPKRLSYIQMAKMGYQELVNAIIRPSRADYKMESLGPPAFNFCGRRFTRTDFTLRTKRGYNLECSHWEPVERDADRIPVVIYMHGNSSARVEVIPQLSYLLSLGLAVFAFDFAGSGKSDGEFVSLGFYEREDLSCIVAHLRATNVVSTIALWGRSMGAATSLMFGDRDPSIACMILDSPFADLTQLCEEMVEKGREQGINVPTFVASVAIGMIRGSVKKQAGFNIKHVSPISHVDKCFIPALFVAGEHDDFIRKHHSEQLHEKYAGDKNLIIVEGDHNSPRPKFMFDSASIFLQTCLQIPNDWALRVPVSMNLMCPPWYFELYEQRASRRRQQQASRSSGRGNSNSRDPAPSSSLSSIPNGTGTSSAAENGSGIPDSNGFDQDEMGMTAERQRVIQASLFKMLGQADDETNSDNNQAS